MATCLPAAYRLSTPFCSHKVLKYFNVRCQSFREDGTSANMVDSNMGILRGRIAEVKMKERLDTWCRLKSGWNYKYHSYSSGCGYDHDHEERYKRDIYMQALLSESLQVMVIVSRSLGLVFLTGFLCLYLVSLLSHSIQ